PRSTPYSDMIRVELLLHSVNELPIAVIYPLSLHDALPICFRATEGMSSLRATHGIFVRPPGGRAANGCRLHYVGRPEPCCGPPPLSCRGLPGNVAPGWQVCFPL